MFETIQKQQKIKILNAAINILAQKGFYGLNVRGLAVDCKMDKSTIYHYFESKRKLVQTIVEEINQYCHQHIFSKYNVKHTSKNEQAKFFIESIEEYFEDYLDHHIAMILLSIELSSSNEGKQKPITRNIKNYFDGWLLYFKRMLENHYDSRKNLLTQNSFAILTGILVTNRLFEEKANFLPYLIDIWRYELAV